MTKVQQHKGQFTITIPENIVIMRNIKKGDEYEWIDLQGYLALRPRR